MLFFWKKLRDPDYCSRFVPEKGKDQCFDFQLSVLNEASLSFVAFSFSHGYFNVTEVCFLESSNSIQPKGLF